ncbi:MAG: hypothetical protein HUU20_19095 [Pirellulales bacterium]|nr:hypothetical protein [Pirellulales bacterium]
MMRPLRIILAFAACSSWLPCARAADNLAVDASFESPLPSWFNERMGTSYYAGKEAVDGAADGRMVLAVEGWDRAGSKILSGPILLDFPQAESSRVSASAAVRSFGKTEGATFELALFDEAGKKKLATFGRLPLDGKATWQIVSQAGVDFDRDAKTCRLGLVPSGPQDDARIEVDCVGLFLGPDLGKVTGNDDLAVVEAEEMADGTIWQAVDHYGGWYQGTPSRMKMLAGPNSIPAQDNRPVSRSISVGLAGPHKLWVRFLSAPYAGRFTVALRQGGTMVAERAFVENVDQIVRAKLMDEPGGMNAQSIAASEPCRKKFADWLKAQGLTPERLGVKTWDEVVPVVADRSGASPELFYYTGLFRLEAFATLAKACVQAKKAFLPDTMLTYVNYSPPTSGGSWTERGTDLFLAHRQGGMELVWTEDWLGYSLGPQHLSDTLALCRAAGRPENRSLGAYCVGQATPELMRMKYYTLLAGGVRDIECYDYGPWYAGIDSWGRQFDLYPAIRQCNFESGAIDPYLRGTVRRKSEVAILYNRTASIWANEDNSCLLNGGFTHWALAHAGFDADYLAEEDVEAGSLSGYKALYLDGRQLGRQSAAAIADWVKQGGVLFATAGAASCDQFNRPLDLLEPVFGASSAEFEAKAAAGRPKYELRGLKPLDHLEPAASSESPAVPLDQFCYRERLDATATAQVVLRDSQERPAGTLNKAGRGTVIRIAALPGISYAYEAAQSPYDPDSYLPRAFRAELRDFMSWPAKLAGAAAVAAADSPIAEIVRYDAADRAVVFIIDHRAEPVERFTFVLPDAAGFTRALAATGAAVELKAAAEGKLSVTLPMHIADAVVLLRADAAKN